MLDAQQIARYRQQGYLVLDRLVSDADLERIRAAAHDIVTAFDADQHRTVFSTRHQDAGLDDYFMASAEAVHCFLEEEALDADGRLTRPKHLAINKIGHALHDRVPAFTAFCRLPAFARLLRDLGYVSPVLWQTMYIFKQPGIGGEVRWHQDASYLSAGAPGVTGLWVAVEQAHVGNGCLTVQPGGHRSPLREIYAIDPQTGRGGLGALDSTPWPAAGEGLALEVPAGGAVLFHERLPHYSSANRSDQSRQAFTMHFAERSAAWSPANWLQRPLLEAFEV